MTSIDHRYHPHVLDIIFAMAPRTSLLALRTASRTFRDRVDRALCKHLSISVAPGVDLLDNTEGPFVSRTLSPMLQDLVILDGDGRRLPAFSSSVVGPTGPDPKERQRDILAATTVINVVGRMTVEHMDFLNPSFNLHTFRMTAHSEWVHVQDRLNLSVERIVFFGDVDIRFGVVVNTNNNLRKVVVHVGSEEEIPIRKLRDITWMCRPRPTPPSRLVLISDQNGTQPFWVPFFDVNLGHRFSQITFVDFHCDLSHDHSSDPAACAVRIPAYLQELIETETEDAPRSRDLSAKFNFMSREQYFATLSAEDVQLETVDLTV
ncbi:uncharacterized protein EHS24_002160 [Apiotrichum porosum]|uniref:Uncharacterized protein n=1 Tax=Apiotrichum porosum TaxID=105984 RepID=A0A427XHT0_9TREE|nr:uncharacterized protein EHS24_002160 [Apiotrichum porosum]RSH78435.1 hypothetical protein EHS24_002160 [Apiotrichum porosum]